MNNVTINIKLKPFSTPNFVVLEMPTKPRQDGFSSDGSSIPISEVDATVLSALCDDFRAEVFRKAGKADSFKL
jgi:hypothetical protein